MIIKHYSDVEWDHTRWPNFIPAELACKCCGEFFWDTNAFDFIQAVRDYLRQPVRIYSAHRCWKHNAKVGGAPLSMHKKIAFDIALARHPQEILQAVRACGVRGVGLYTTFLHADLGRPRRWFGKGYGQTWTGLI